MASVVVIVLGVLSRVVQTGSALFDKYLGDALYAVLIYLLLAAVVPQQARRQRAMLSMVLVIAIECFQLTGIPTQLAAESDLPSRLLATALGTHFSWLDLVAYLAGVAVVYGVDRTLGLRRRTV